ncbi:MAG: DUF4163 domain-containing protein [Phascolarctobacterium sp.]|nr:DUF4163 domain-containing protein [Phascolarctobacterium sp.]
MLKKTLLALGLSFTLCATAFAAITEQVETGKKYKCSYPVFTLESQEAADLINNDILGFVNNVKKLAKGKDPEVVEVGLQYKIIEETDTYVNLVITPWDYLGGAHGMYYDNGIVYDKHTGERVPYFTFTNPVTSVELYNGIANGSFPVYMADLKTRSDAPFLEYIKPEQMEVSQFYILQNGKVYLMYYPYYLDCYAAGTTYVELPRAN